MLVALGREIAGVMGTSDDLIGQILDASDRAGEPMWRLPVPDRYRKHLDSEVADMKNIGNPGQAGTIVAGLFLQEFVGDVPWAHLDIAGTALNSPQGDINKSWSAGWGVRLLERLVADYYER